MHQILHLNTSGFLLHVFLSIFYFQNKLRINFYLCPSRKFGILKSLKLLGSLIFLDVNDQANNCETNEAN